MAIVNISEADYGVLASACLNARDRGDMEEAAALNLICRKADRALSGNTAGAQLAKAMGAKAPRQRGYGPLDLDPLQAEQKGGA